MSEDRKPQSADKYIVRFPDGMRDRIAEEAKKNNRSMNAEIVARLQGSLNAVDTARSSVPRILDTLERELAQSAMERGVLKLNGNALADAVRLLVKLIDEKSELQPDHRERLLDLAARGKSNIQDTNAFLIKAQEELDSNAALTAELGMELIEEIELALNPVQMKGRRPKSPIGLPELMEKAGAKSLKESGDKASHSLNPKPTK